MWHEYMRIHKCFFALYLGNNNYNDAANECNLNREINNSLLEAANTTNTFPHLEQNSKINAHFAVSEINFNLIFMD